eukprot:6211056-Pleurochrysis_carterae.AAC.2
MSIKSVPALACLLTEQQQLAAAAPPAGARSNCWFTGALTSEVNSPRAVDSSSVQQSSVPHEVHRLSVTRVKETTFLTPDKLVIINRKLFSPPTRSNLKRVRRVWKPSSRERPTHLLCSLRRVRKIRAFPLFGAQMRRVAARESGAQSTSTAAAATRTAAADLNGRASGPTSGAGKGSTKGLLQLSGEAAKQLQDAQKKQLRERTHRPMRAHTRMLARTCMSACAYLSCCYMLLVCELTCPFRSCTWRHKSFTADDQAPLGVWTQV